MWRLCEDILKYSKILGKIIKKILCEDYVKNMFYNLTII